MIMVSPNRNSPKFSASLADSRDHGEGTLRSPALQDLIDILKGNYLLGNCDYCGGRTPDRKYLEPCRVCGGKGRVSRQR